MNWRKRLKNNEGVTLIELIIVLSIGLIIVHCCLYSFSSADRRRMQQACEALRGDFRYAQRMAMVEGRRYRVTFNSEDDGYDILRMEKDTAKGKSFKSVILPEGISIYWVNTAYVEYNPRGTDNQAFTIQLRSETYTAEMTGNLGAGRIAVKSIKPNA